MVRPQFDPIGQARLAYCGVTEHRHTHRHPRIDPRWLGGAAVLGLIALVLPPGNASQAQTVAEPAEVVSQTPGGTAYTGGGSRDSSIAADGRFVEFDAAGEDQEVVIRDRVGNTTNRVTLVPGLTGSISDNGCVVAYTHNVPLFSLGSGSEYPLYAFDRCAGLNLIVGSAFVVSGDPKPRPKPNQDGSVIVWSTPISIEHSTRSGNTYTEGVPITFPRVPAPVFGPNVALSDDGNLVAFETASGSVALLDRRTPAAVEAISVDDGGKTVTGASDPSISGDGTLVTYTLAPVFSGGALSVVLRDRPNGVNRAIATPATSAEISRDGRYVAVLLRIGEIGETYVVRSTSAQPFATVATDLVSYRDGDPATGTFGSTNNPAISEHGRWVTFDSYAASLLVPGQGFDGSGTQVYVRQRRPAVTVDSIDFGTVGGATDRQATVRSVGLAGFEVTSIAATGDFSVVGHTCPAVLHPDATCLVTVRFNASAAGSASGVLTVQDDSYPGVPLSGTGKLFGSYDPGTPTVPTTTPPPTTVPRPPGTAELSIAPDPVLFDGVVVGSAAPQRSATVTNTGDVSVTISSVSLSGGAAADFSVANDACTGVALASGTSCQLDLGFSPSQAGGRSATVTASGSGSTSASAGLSGSGRFDAVLMVTPEVAAGGQVVTVVGTGFPPSADVSLVLGDDAAVIVATDAAGAFMHPWLILSGIPQGELLADDVAVVGSYDAEPAPLQVVGTPMRPQATATLSRLGRSHVSR